MFAVLCRPYRANLLVITEKIGLTPYPPLCRPFRAFISFNNSLSGLFAINIPLLEYYFSFLTFTIFVGSISLLRRLTTVTTAWARLMNAWPVTVSML